MKIAFPTFSDQNFLKNIQNLTSSVSEGVVIADAKENILWVNRAFENMHGDLQKNCANKKTDILQWIETDKKTASAIRQKIDKRKNINIELQNYKAGKTSRRIRLNIMPVFDKHKMLTNFIIVEHDITKEKDQELFNSEKFYKSLFEKNPDIMFIFDKNSYRMLEVNLTALNVYGYTHDEFLKLTIKDIRPKGDWEKVKKILPKVKEDFVMQGIWQHRKKNGEHFYVEVKATQIVYKGKKAILVIPTDVTERVNREREIKNLNSNLVDLNTELYNTLQKTEQLNLELKIKEHKLITAQEAAKIGTWEINLKTNKIICSEEVYNIFEFPKDKKLTFTDFKKKIHPADRSRYNVILNDVITGGMPLNIEYKIKLDGGRHKHIVSQGAMLPGEKGKPELILGITVDVTSKKHSEELIRKQLSNINIILESISEPFYIIDRKYNLLFINDTSAKMSGFRKEDLIGKNIWNIYPDRDFKQEKREYAKALRENKPRWFQTEHYGRTYSVNLYPSEIGLAISAKDITEKKNSEAKLIENAKFIKEISDNTPGGIIQTVYYPDGKVEAPFISAGFEELWGIPVNEVMKDAAKRFDAIHPDDLENVKSDLAVSIKNNTPLNHKFRYINQKTKEIKWVQAKAVTTKKDDGKVILNGVFIDITESERYYSELEKSNERYEYVSKASQEGIWDWDLTTGIITIGGNYTDMMKAPSGITSITKEQFLSAIHPDDKNRVLARFDKFIHGSSNRLWEDTFKMTNLAGETLHAYGRGYVIYDEDKNIPVRIVGSTIDVTAKIKAEKELKDNAKFIEEIGDNIPGALFQEIFYPDGTFKITYLSQGFEKFWGVKIEEIALNPLNKLKLIHPDDVEIIKGNIEAIWNYSKINHKFRYINQKTGEVFWVRVNGVTNKNGDGSLTLTGVVIDVSETERYYAELEKSNLKYECVSKASNEAIWEWDLGTNIFELGGNYQEIFGYDFHDNKVSFDFVMSKIYHEDFEYVQQSIQRGLTDYENHFRESYYRMLRADNEIIYVYERSYTLFDEKTKTPLKIIGTTQNVTQRKKDEESLREKAQFIQSISNNVPGAIFQSVYYSDGSSKMTYASEGFESLWGIPVSTVLENPELRFEPIHSEDKERVKKEIDGAVKSLSNLDCRFRFINQKTGKISSVRSKSLPVKMGDGSINLTGIMIDITNSERYYAELEKSNQRFEYVSKAANEVIWDLDLNTKIIKYGGSYKEMFGYVLPDDKCKYENIPRMIHPEDKERVLKKIESTLKDKTKRYWEDYYKVIKKEGGIVYVYDRGYVIYDEKLNKPVRFVGATQDITQRKLDEEAMSEQIRKMNIVVESMTDPFFVLGKELEVILANKAGLELTKCSSKELIGKYIYNFDFVNEQRELFDLFKKAIDENKTFHEEFLIKDKWFDILLYPSEIGLAVYSKDITEKKRRQEELEKNTKFIKEISDSSPGFSFQLEFDKQLNPKLNFASEKAEEYWGFPVKSAVEGKSELFSSIHKDDIKGFKAAVKNSVTNLVNLSFKYRLINIKTNETKWVRVAAIPTRLNNNNTLVNGVVIDITDEENYYNKLEEANLRYEHVSKATNNAIWELDLKTGMCTMGGAYEEMYGYKLKDDILSDEFHSILLHPDDLERVLKSKKDALSDISKRYWEITYRIVKNGGEVRHVQDRAYIVYNGNLNTPVKIIGSTQDITQSIKHEEEIKRNTKFIEEISDSMQGFIFQTEYNELFVAKLNYASKNAFDYWGITVEEVMEDGTKLLDSIHFEDITDVMNKRLESVKNLTNMNIKFRYVNKQTGDIKWVRAVAVPTRLDNGHTLVNGTIIDITETENYYNKLEEATRRYEYLSKATHETIWEMDLASRDILLGGGYREMFGTEFPDNKIKFSQWESFVHPDDLKRVVNSMEEVISDTSKRYWESSYRVLREDEKMFDVFERAYIVYDEKNMVPLKIIGSTQDVTELKKIQEERDAMFADLLKRNSALEQFTYMVSHNLRAPIANILGISAILEENDLDEKSRLEMNQMIQQSSSRLDEVIRDMNDVLSIKKNRDEEKTEVEFDTILSEIKDMEKHAIEKSKIKIISDLRKPHSVVSVKSFLFSIFQNLITNSIKYKRELNPYMKISSSEDERYVYLKFEDNGLGIDLHKNKDKIFGLYNRFHLNREGKGMGLFMVKNQVEALNGDISIESEVNKGTKFLIKLIK